MRKFVIDTRKYAISVRVLTGQGDGDLIYIDGSGRIRHIGPNPPPLRLTDKIKAALKQVETGLAALDTELRTPAKTADAA